LRDNLHCHVAVFAPPLDGLQFARSHLDADFSVPPQSKSEVRMTQQERKDRDQRTRSDEKQDQAGLQRSSGREGGLWRDPFAGFWGGRDPFASFWEPFGLTTRNAWPFQTARQGSGSLWSPQIESFQRGDQFVVRADLPGMKKDDMNIEISDDSVIIRGERREEHEEDREGYYRSERSYGSFYRAVPLPEGAITESAKADFNNGVLEISVQAPPREVSRRRRIEIGESAEKGRSEKERAKTESQR
jgi:HSP20 family molecular chaperone IbpA